MPEPASGVKPASSERERLRRPVGRQTRTRTAPAPPSPTRSIEPGHVHYRIAGGVLKGLQTKARDVGIDLDVGEIPNPDASANGENSDNPELLTQLVARVVARLADRFPLSRKLSRHLEGSAKRSGLLSDLSAAAIELYHRNPDVIEGLGKQAAQDFKARRDARATEKPKPTNGGIANAPR